jgi:hypothetical protein
MVAMFFGIDFRRIRPMLPNPPNSGVIFKGWANQLEAAVGFFFKNGGSWGLLAHAIFKVFDPLADAGIWALTHYDNTKCV